MSAIHHTFPTQQPSRRLSRLKAVTGMLAASVLSLLFMASGLWKLMDLTATADRMAQLLVPKMLSGPAALLVAAGETLAAILLLIPSCRRWGAWLAGLLLAIFMCYVAIFYGRLLGDDCNCFPWIRRVVGPGFFIGDAVMLGLALAGGVWSKRTGNLRQAAVALAGVFLLVAVSYSVSVFQRAQVDVPAAALVGNQPVSLQQGRFLLYFFDPQCTHCEAIARMMAKWNWGDTRILALPTAEPRFAASFLKDTGLHADICLEAERLRRVSPFTTAPHAVALNRGRLIAAFNFGQFEDDGFRDALKRSGHIR